MSNPKEKLIFSRGWLSLDKADIEMISFLLLKGRRFEGSVSELCRSLGRSDGTRSRNGRQQSIDNLRMLGIIKYTQKTTRRFEIILSAPIEENQIVIERQHLENIMCRRYERSVAWQQVLKVYLWLKACGNGPITFQRHQIADVLNVSTSTITEATHVLNEHYGAITTQRIGYVDGNGNPRCLGQEAQLSAFWLKD